MRVGGVDPHGEGPRGRTTRPDAAPGGRRATISPSRPSRRSSSPRASRRTPRRIPRGTPTDARHGASASGRELEGMEPASGRRFGTFVIRATPIRGGSATGGRGEDVDAARRRSRAVGIDARGRRLRRVPGAIRRVLDLAPAAADAAHDEATAAEDPTGVPILRGAHRRLGADDVRRGVAARARRGRGARGVVQAPRGRGARVRGRV